MLFTLFIIWIIYIGLLFHFTEKNPSKKSYRMGGAFVFVAWFITAFLVDGFIVGFSGSSLSAYSPEELDARILISTIFNWASFLLYLFLFPAIFKRLSR